MVTSFPKSPFFFTHRTVEEHLPHTTLSESSERSERERERSAHRHTALERTNIKRLIKSQDGISRSRAAESQHRARQMYVHGNNPPFYHSCKHFVFSPYSSFCSQRESSPSLAGPSVSSAGRAVTKRGVAVRVKTRAKPFPKGKHTL